MRQHYKHYSDDEKECLIMECRQSGLSDYQWCRENDIKNHYSEKISKESL